MQEYGDGGIGDLASGDYGLTVDDVEDNMGLEIDLNDYLAGQSLADPMDLPTPETDGGSFQRDIPLVVADQTDYGDLSLTFAYGSSQDAAYIVTGSADIEATFYVITCTLSGTVTGTLTPVTGSEFEMSLALSDVEIGGDDLCDNICDGCNKDGTIVVNVTGLLE